MRDKARGSLPIWDGKEEQGHEEANRVDGLERLLQILLFEAAAAVAVDGAERVLQLPLVLPRLSW